MASPYKGTDARLKYERVVRAPVLKLPPELTLEALKVLASTDDLQQRIAEEGEILNHQVALLRAAKAGVLDQDSLDAELRDYLLNGKVGRA